MNGVGPQGWGFGTYLLPYLEQQALLAQLTPDHTTGQFPVNPADLNNLTQTSLTVFQCPSDSSAILNNHFGNHGKSNYPPNNHAFGNGPRGLRMSDIRDGTSNTIMIGERDLVKNRAALWVGRWK